MRCRLLVHQHLENTESISNVSRPSIQGLRCPVETVSSTVSDVPDHIIAEYSYFGLNIVPGSP